MPQHILNELSDFGAAHLNARARGEGTADPERFTWSGFVGPVFDALNGPQRDQAIDELCTAAHFSRDPENATIGAYVLISEAEPESQDPRFLALFDSSLDALHTRGFSSAHLNTYEHRRWLVSHPVW